MPVIYFASDLHLGIPSHAKSLERERKIVRWLDKVSADADEIILLGDVFDFWFEYRFVVPKGFVRLLGKIAELSDKGIKITLFKGNHDMWMFGYLEKECGVKIIDNEWVTKWGDKSFYLHHGDGLGPGDKSYKLIRKIFRNKLCQWMFAFIHPYWGMKLATWLSSRSRLANEKTDDGFNEPNEWLLQYCKELLKSKTYDYLIFGHRHLPLDIAIGNSRYINLGEWVHQFYYARFDGINLKLIHFEEN